MTLFLALLGGMAALAALVSGGAMAAADLAHPFWQTQATLNGGGAGVILAAALLWLSRGRPGAGRAMAAGAGLSLAAALWVTWRAARIFISSAEFEPMAGRVWFLGYHAVAALVVLTVAMTIGQLRRDFVRRA